MAGTFRLDELRNLALEAFAVQEQGVDVRSGLAGALGTAGPIAVGVATGHRVEAVIASIAAMNAALCVPRAGIRARLWWSGVYLAGSLVSVVLADLTGGTTWLLVPTTLLWVGITALIRGAGPKAAITGFATSAVFVVLAGIPPSGPTLANRLLWFTAGAVPALLLMMAARRGPAGSGGVARSTVRLVGRQLHSDPLLRIHALRLGLAVALATAVERVLKLQYGYWVALTVLSIIQPGQRATNVRIIQRTAGTLVGVAVIILITLLTGNAWALIVCTAAAAFWLFALDERGYFWLVVMLTPTALLLLSVSDFQGIHVGVDRTLNSALGILLGLAIGEVGFRLGGR
jgi:Fusaric acid resistance protein-like